jgi:hypothetical protein
MQGFFWPTKAQAAPTIVARFGRFLHWAGIVMASPVVALTAQIAVTEPSGDYGHSMLLFFAAPVYMAGRGARYFLGGE